jgi:hypothetical protein
MGRTPQFTPTRLSGGPDSGIVDIRIVGMDGNCLVGESIAAEIRGAA